MDSGFLPGRQGPPGHRDDRAGLLGMTAGIELETPRLRLRPWRGEDRTPFAAINGAPSVLQFLLPVTREQSDAMLDRVDAHFAQHGWGFWAVEERASGTLIGMCGLYHIPWP